MRRLLIGLVLRVGCGDDPAPDGPLADTAWVSSLGSCGDALVFSGGDAYRWLHVCGANTYVEDGVYVVAAGQIALTPRAASCATAGVRTDSIATDVRPGSGELTLGSRAFVKVATGPGLGPYAVTGCFDGAVFSPLPIAPVR